MKFFIHARERESLGGIDHVMVRSVSIVSTYTIPKESQISMLLGFFLYRWLNHWIRLLGNASAPESLHDHNTELAVMIWLVLLT